MIIKQDFVNKVKSHFNLNIYETKVWLALISKGIASAGEIAEISGVPRSRTYDVLESLEKRGFAMAKVGKPVRYIAVKPTLIIEKLKNDTFRKAEEKANMLSKLKETQEYSELETLHNTGLKPIKREEVSGALRGKSNINLRIREMLENAKKEIIICISTSEINKKSRIFSSLFEKLKKSKISVKVALHGDNAEINKTNTKFNIKAKKTDIKSRFFMIDREQILFMLNKNDEKENEDDIAIWLNSDFFVTSMANLFDIAMKKK